MWHPVLTAIESPTGVWTLHGQQVADVPQPTAVVRILRRGDEVGYRGELLDGTIVGYWTTLLTACSETHSAWVGTLGPGPGQYSAYDVEDRRRGLFPRRVSSGP